MTRLNAPRPRRAPESTGKLDAADTNPLPASSAKAWPKTSKVMTPIIVEKAQTLSSRHVRVDGTEEIRAEDIMIVVPKALTKKRPSATSEIEDNDIVVELGEPEFRPPAYSIHATQEILADDVIEVQAMAAQLATPPPTPKPQGRDELPSAPPPPWTIDAVDEFEFPTPPLMSGPYPQVRERITNFSATEVYRRRGYGLKVVFASVTFAISVVCVAGIAKVAPTLGTGGPVGIVLHTPKTLEKNVRPATRVVGTAPKLVMASISLDDLGRVTHTH